VLISDIIRGGLGKGIDVSVLQGANVANEVADGNFCEATLGYTIKSNAEHILYAFNTPTFRVQLVNDPIGVELCGGLKSIVGLGAGM
jgi:glycerol-3-phosphate dehydrogenase (NAD+)